MPVFARSLMVFTAIVIIMVPLALWIYQVAQFGGWNWDIGRMTADRIVATSAKAIVASVIFSAMIMNLERISGFAVRNSEA